MQNALSVMQVARRLNLSEPTVRKLIADGALKAYKVGRQFRIEQPELQAFIRNGSTPNRTESEHSAEAA